MSSFTLQDRVLAHHGFSDLPSSPGISWMHTGLAYKLQIVVSQTPQTQTTLQELMYDELIFINFYFRVLVPVAKKILTSSWKCKGLSPQKKTHSLLKPARKTVEILTFISESLFRSHLPRSRVDISDS